jgi:hypothetical protein
VTARELSSWSNQPEKWCPRQDLNLYDVTH